MWRGYLRSWASNDQIWCCRSKKIFKTNLVNIGQERDFYKIKSLSRNDIKFILEMNKKRHFGMLNEYISWWVNLLSSIDKLKIEYEKKDVKRNDIKNKIDILINNFEEDYHSSIEGNSNKFIKSIINKDIDFFDQDVCRYEFSVFLAHQYVRTKKIRENIYNSFRDVTSKISVNIESAWSAMRNIDAISIALAIYSKKEYRIILLENNSNISYITGDQPVLNIHAVDDFGNKIPTKTEFYYPVSPNIAILLSNDKIYKHKKYTLSENDVVKYNSFIKRVSHEQIYANSDSLF